MAVYNSSMGLNQDDSDITIIHPSIIHEHQDEYVDSTQTTASPSSAATPTTATSSTDESSHNNHDYIFVDHNPKEQAKQLEQVLAFYTRDLKQDGNTQFSCAQQLVIRLMNLIRPAYPHDQQKMIELDRVMNEIAELHDKRLLEQKEKDEQLRLEICQLNKTLCAARNEQSTYDSMPRNYSAMNSLLRGSIDRQENWTEIDDDTEKLHQIVQTQRNQINEIVNLVSEAATTAASLETPKTSDDHAEAMSLEVQPSPAVDHSLVTALIQKIRRITTQEQPAAAQEVILQNHSPGASPTQSLATLTLTSINAVHEEELVQRVEPTPEIVREETASAADGAAAFTRHIEPQKCPVCEHQFDPTLPDAEVYDHIDKCLFPTVPKPEPQDYECPECNRKWPLADEHGYLQHLSDCFNREV